MLITPSSPWAPIPFGSRSGSGPWPTSSLCWLCCLMCLFLSALETRAMSHSRRIELREEVREMFRHGFMGYMEYAYPADELKPLSCGPSYRDPDVTNHGINDIHANASMTLLDTLSTLPELLPEEYPRALDLAATEVSFDQDVKVQVFEMTIRALGGLLSTYQHLESLPLSPKDQAKALGLDRRKVDVKQYQPRMLEMALDLGERLFPAFNTGTGIPYARVNLRYGVAKDESEDTCAAGAGSLILEFAVLSRLTGDTKFETAARRAYYAIWARRSPHNLLGNTIGALHGQWLAPGMSGVQAGMDSYFEYALKAAILLGDDTFSDIFDDAYAAIQTFVRTPDGFIYRPVQFRMLQLSNPSTIDSLSAFFAGVQVLAGDLESAIRNHLVHWNLWRRYSGSPESWSWMDRSIQWAGWPGRPEFIESTYYLYQATQDPFYLRVGERVLHDINARVRTKCGFATMKNVETGELEDRMESFVLSELFKYLYLLFDPTPPSGPSNQVFTTEGQSLYLPSKLTSKPLPISFTPRRGDQRGCPAYAPPTLGGLRVGIEQRQDYEYARALVYGPGVNGRAEETGQVHWSESGYCAIPSAPRYGVDITLAPANETSNTRSGASKPDDAMDGGLDADLEGKVVQDSLTGDFAISDVSGLHMTVRWRHDSKGYDIATIGSKRVYPGQKVIVTDPQMEGFLPVATPSEAETITHLPAEVILRFSVLPSGSSSGNKQVFLHALGATATFGRDFGETGPEHWGLGGGSIKLVMPDSNNAQGCSLYDTEAFIPHLKLDDPDNQEDFVLLLQRGGCTFFDKLVGARTAGAVGVLVIDEPPLLPPGAAAAAAKASKGDKAQLPLSLDEGTLSLIRPSAEGEPGFMMEQMQDTGMVFTTYLVGELLKRMIGKEGKDIEVELMLAAENELMAVQVAVEDEDVDPGRGRGATAESRSGRASKEGQRGDQVEEEPREGRLALGEWIIWNLKIVERPP